MRPIFQLRLIPAIIVSFALAYGACADEQDDLNTAKKQLRTLNSELQKYQSEYASVETAIRDQEIELSKLHREIYNTDRDIGLTEATLQLLHSQRDQLNLERSQQEQAIRADLVAIYKAGNQEPIKILLNQDDPTQLSRMLIYYRYLFKARTTKIDLFNQTMAEIANNQVNIDRQNTQLKALAANLKQQQSSLKASQARQARLLERLQGRILSTEQQIAEHQENARRLELLINDTAERITELAPPENYRPFVELKGQYLWPVSGKISHHFGSARTGDVRWQGVLLTAELGEEVKSIHHGRVVFADYMRGYGLLVIVDHKDGYMTLYGHNQSLFVEPGDWVAPGEQLALVGNTGGLSEKGLYFEVRRQGKPINPSHWCSG